LFVALWGAVLFSLALVMGLSERLHQLERAGAQAMSVTTGLMPEVPKVGAELPSVPGRDELLAIFDEPRTGRVVLFLSTTCAPCLRLGDQLMGDDVAEFADDLAAVNLVLVTDEHGPTAFHSARFARVIVDHDGELSGAFGVKAIPAAIAVDLDGLVRGVNLPSGLADVASLARSCGSGIGSIALSGGLPASPA
jgi:hypothetical protein